MLTSQDYNLSPTALRKFYSDFNKRIIEAKGTYVPVDQRPPKWPFHQKPAANPEAAVMWIFDWGSVGAQRVSRVNNPNAEGAAQIPEDGDELKDEYDSEDEAPMRPPAGCATDDEVEAEEIAGQVCELVNGDRADTIHSIQSR
jgi:hypothetical protein